MNGFIKFASIVLSGIALTLSSYAGHHENKDINGLFTLEFDLGPDQITWAVAVDDEVGATTVVRNQLQATGKLANGVAFSATGDCGGLQNGSQNSGVCLWSDEDGSTWQVRFTCEDTTQDGFCWGSASGLTGKYKGKVNRWSQANEGGRAFAAGIWADAN